MWQGWSRWIPVPATSSAVLLVLTLAVGCDSTGMTEGDSARFVGTYVDPSGPVGTIRLDVHAGGTFTLTLCERGFGDPTEGEREIARGSWTPLGEGIELDAEEWRATLVSHSVPVTIAGRTDTLPGLRWISESESAPLKSGRLVRRREFDEFLHPPEGSGTEGM